MPEVKPKVCKNKHLKYLDGLRKTGITNMFGAGSYLQDAFPELTSRDAQDILMYWMKTFTERHSK